MSNMINFYAANTAAIEKNLIQLIEKIYDSGKKVLFRVSTAEEMKFFDDLLWTYSQKKFLAHAALGTEWPLEQPIYITHLVENANEASILLLLNAANDTDRKNFQQIIYFFDGKNESLTKSMRNKFQDVNQQINKTIYWQQDEKGSWRELAA